MASKKTTKKSGTKKPKVHTFKMLQPREYDDVAFFPGNKHIEADVRETIERDVTLKGEVGSSCGDGLYDALGFEPKPGVVYLITITETDEKPVEKVTRDEW